MAAAMSEPLPPTPARAAAHARPLDALARVLGSLEALRNGRAIYLLLFAFALAGLLLAMADAALGRGQWSWAALWGGMALTALFYGSNAAGLVLWDDARALRPPRDAAQALRDALGCGHRLLLVLLAIAVLAAAGLGVVTAALWLTRLPWLGPALFGLLLPAAVLLVGGALLAGATVIAPLSAPAVWSGLSVRATLSLLLRHVRRRLVFVALLSAAVGALAALVGALTTFVVVSGGRVVAALAVLAAGVDVPPRLLMAGLFGHGLRSLGAAGAPIAASPHAQAALVGGGVVFVVALVLPALVYLRGNCAVFLALEERERADADS
jgi:hypothetical protein